MLKSLPPKDYLALPALDAPAGYICVIRDIGRDAYRIQGTQDPASLVHAASAGAEGKMGIELISILKSADLSASESGLYEAHQARLGSAWLTLDAYQLGELRSSALQIDSHSSHYLTPQLARQSQQAPVSEGTRYELLMAAYLQGADRQERPKPPTIKEYGRAGLRRHRYRPVSLPVDEDAPEPPPPPEPGTLGYRFWQWTEKHPNVLPRIVTVLVIILIIVLMITTPATGYRTTW
ncbi:MAG: hypothetical protein F4X02_06250 [Chloroflexi bacterium]|nr:hypothetical protein [Chloroflexota bacterium]